MASMSEAVARRSALRYRRTRLFILPGGFLFVSLVLIKREARRGFGWEFAKESMIDECQSTIPCSVVREESRGSKGSSRRWRATPRRKVKTVHVIWNCIMF